MFKKESKQLEMAKSIFEATAKRLRRELEKQYINAKFEEFTPDFDKGVYVVRLWIHGRSIKKRFGLFMDPDEIHEEMGTCLTRKLEEIFCPINGEDD